MGELGPAAPTCAFAGEHGDQTCAAPAQVVVLVGDLPRPSCPEHARAEEDLALEAVAGVRSFTALEPAGWWAELEDGSVAAWDASGEATCLLMGDLVVCVGDWPCFEVRAEVLLDPAELDDDCVPAAAQVLEELVETGQDAGLELVSAGVFACDWDDAVAPVGRQVPEHGWAAQLVWSVRALGCCGPEQVGAEQIVRSVFETMAAGALVAVEASPAGPVGAPSLRARY